MGAKLAKDSGKYYVIHENGTYTDISESLEKEIKKRVDIEVRLSQYNQEIDNSVHFRLATVTSQLVTAKKFLRRFTDISKRLFEAWSKANSCHGQMLEMKNECELADKWLEESKATSGK